MAIDDPKAAFEQQYMQEAEKSPLALAVFTSKLAFPKAALPLEIFRKVADRLTRASVEERLQAMWNMLVIETEHLAMTLIGRAQEFTVQVALALGQPTEKNTYTREVGYGICARLQGFGLAHEFEQTRELPLTNYTFRLSVQGIRLLKLLGEPVPNYDYYFRDKV